VLFNTVLKRSFLPKAGVLHDGECGSRLVTVSIWNDEEAKALAQSFGAVTLFDELVPTILAVR
jgi:hypothetical protein